jgi:hypothetical protein
MDLHLIPDVPEAWELNRYDDFINARKKLIQEKFKYMLALRIQSPHWLLGRVRLLRIGRHAGKILRSELCPL